jgi:hypothetical protein
MDRYDRKFLARGLLLVFIIANLVLVMFMSVGIALGDWSGLIIFDIILTQIALVLMWELRRIGLRIYRVLIDDDGNVRKELKGTLHALRQIVKEWIKEVGG